jgi:hypothetical protein
MTDGMSNPGCPAQMRDPVVAQWFCMNVREGTSWIAVSVKPVHDKMDVFPNKKRPAFTHLKNSIHPALFPRASIDESRIGVGVIL